MKRKVLYLLLIFAAFAFSGCTISATVPQSGGLGGPDTGYGTSAPGANDGDMVQAPPAEFGVMNYYDPPFVLASCPRCSWQYVPDPDGLYVNLVFFQNGAEFDAVSDWYNGGRMHRDHFHHWGRSYRIHRSSLEHHHAEMQRHHSHDSQSAKHGHNDPGQNHHAIEKGKEPNKGHQAGEKGKEPNKGHQIGEKGKVEKGKEVKGKEVKDKPTDKKAGDHPIVKEHNKKEPGKNSHTAVKKTRGEGGQHQARHNAGQNRVRHDEGSAESSTGERQMRQHQPRGTQPQPQQMQQPQQHTVQQHAPQPQQQHGGNGGKQKKN